MAEQDDRPPLSPGKPPEPISSTPLPSAPGAEETQSMPGATQAQFGPLSIQAASLVRSIEALSNIFWISLGGTFLTIFFAGLAQLEVNASSDYISLGEYQVPKAILPLAGVAFALFAFWMTANRLRMLSYVLGTTQLPRPIVHEIFHLNPPILHVFDRDNANPWSPFTGVSVLLVNWAVFIGNSIALTWEGIVQQVATAASTDLPTLVIYSMLIVGVVFYGMRSIPPPLAAIIAHLHGIEVRLGWQRVVMVAVVIVGVIVANSFDQIRTPAEQADDLIGPAFANAIDGETLFMNGVQVNLFGIDSVEHDQICQNEDGSDYACGKQATLALQRIVQNNEVVCLPVLAVNENRVVAACDLVTPGEPYPMRVEHFIGEEYRASELSRRMIELGYAISVGLGKRRFDEEQRQAQTLRVGIWQGSFEPPALWRSRSSN